MKSFVWDTETTNLIENIGRPLKDQPYIIEFFGITVDHDLMNEPGYLETAPTLSFLCRPPFAITAETTRITGITPDLLKNVPEFRHFAPKVKETIEAHDRVVAHNAGYDVDMTNFDMRRVDQTIEWPEVICTIEGTEWLKGYRLNLGALHTELFGFDFADHHRAEPDTRALAKCYIELINRGIL
jgi:DNA polymerase III epsilon subunit-like protein